MREQKWPEPGAHALDEALAERRGQVSGHLRIIAPLGFGRRYVAPLAARFQQEHPQVDIELTLTDRLSGIPASSWDVAVQVGELQRAPPSLLMRNLADNARFVCAAPSYIDELRAGRLTRILQDHALPDAPVVAFLGSGHQARAARTGWFVDALANSLTPAPWRT